MEKNTHQTDRERERVETRRTDTKSKWMVCNHASGKNEKREK